MKSAAVVVLDHIFQGELLFFFSVVDNPQSKAVLLTGDQDMNRRSTTGFHLNFRGRKQTCHDKLQQTDVQGSHQLLFLSYLEVQATLNFIGDAVSSPQVRPLTWPSPNAALQRVL